MNHYSVDEALTQDELSLKYNREWDAMDDFVLEMNGLEAPATPFLDFEKFFKRRHSDAIRKNIRTAEETDSYRKREAQISIVDSALRAHSLKEWPIEEILPWNAGPEGEEDPDLKRGLWPLTPEEIVRLPRDDYFKKKRTSLMVKIGEMVATAIAQGNYNFFTNLSREILDCKWAGKNGEIAFPHQAEELRAKSSSGFGKCRARRIVELLYQKLDEWINGYWTLPEGESPWNDREQRLKDGEARLPYYEELEAALKRENQGEITEGQAAAIKALGLDALPRLKPEKS